jgi:hypothetical protein
MPLYLTVTWYRVKISAWNQRTCNIALKVQSIRTSSKLMLLGCQLSVPEDGGIIATHTLQSRNAIERQVRLVRPRVTDFVTTP